MSSGYPDDEPLDSRWRLWVSMFRFLEGVSFIRDPVTALLHPFSFRQGENIKSRIESARFVARLSRDVARCATRWEVMEWSVRHSTSSGLFLEFGVATGKTIHLMARLLSERQIAAPVFGFDSFGGLPEAWRRGIPAGTFARDTPPPVASNIQLVIGLFQDTLGPFLETHPGGVSLVHIDSDLYSSAVFVLKTLARFGRLVEGTLILFDELFNYPNWTIGGEYKALSEAFPTSELDISIAAIVPVDQQVVVRLERTKRD